MQFSVTQEKENIVDLGVIARSEATWQSVFSLVTGAKSGHFKGNGLPRHLSALARNDIHSYSAKAQFSTLSSTADTEQHPMV